MEKENPSTRQGRYKQQRQQLEQELKDTTWSIGAGGILTQSRLTTTNRPVAAPASWQERGRPAGSLGARRRAALKAQNAGNFISLLTILLT